MFKRGFYFLSNESRRGILKYILRAAGAVYYVYVGSVKSV